MNQRFGETISRENCRAEIKEDTLQPFSADGMDQLVYVGQRCPCDRWVRLRAQPEKAQS